ncbi:hypothetical protein T484DRAFT_1651262 [Baffinella frigidus]|nr:hypothetical protein T484DRAFT_1651262 [Cryptophyta sp. CCMP2293]
MASTGDGGGSAVSAACAACGLDQPAEMYTSRQWRARAAGTGKCRGCVVAALAAAGKDWEVTEALREAAAAGLILEAPKVAGSEEGAERAPFSVSAEQLQMCIDVLEQFEGRGEIFQRKEYRSLRNAVQPLVVFQREQQYGSESRVEKHEQLLNSADTRRRKQRELALDQTIINRRQMRASRLDKLRALMEGGNDGLPLIADGVADDSPAPRHPAIADDADDAEGGGELAAGSKGPEADTVSKPRACYACKGRFLELHHFYSDLCPPCAQKNYAKRTATAPLGGRVALLTGGRVKIGFQTGLKLLRCGATVIITTRFPKDCAQRYAEQADSSEWRARLRVVGLDFRDVAAVEAFCDYLNATLPALDIIINNACQTVRRPPAYYRHLLDVERRPASDMPLATSKLLLTRVEGTGGGGWKTLQDGGVEDSEGGAGVVGGVKCVGGVDLRGLSSAEQSQLPLLVGDGAEGGGLFPSEKLDVNAQQVDLRTKNSWLLKLDEVELPELAEVFTINTFAPYLFNSKLKPLLLKSDFAPRFIVNVSAMEGKFYRFKSANHPHTNMAKAALNMMTRTAAQGYAQDGILMNAVDTGWINDENPLERARDIAEEHNFQTPIDEVDAAARILDPVVSIVNGGRHEFGMFYKDYLPTEW